MLRLRRAWLVAIACMAAVGGGSALVMRAELVAPGEMLPPDVYARALGLHAITMVGMLVAAFIAIPTLLVRPGRRAVELGSVALAVWAAMMAFFSITAFAPSGLTSLHAACVVLAIGIAAAVAQLAVSLPASADAPSRPSAIAAITAIVALVFVGIPLATGKLPTTTHLLTASTVAACGVVSVSRGSATASIVRFAVAPCLATAWIATVYIHTVRAAFVLDTVAVLAPFPALGGAVLAALFVAIAHGRGLRPRLARVATALFAGGTIATSAGLLLVGARGLPRRYQDYDSMFQPLQVLVGVAAVISVIGAIAAFKSIARGPRE